MSDSVEILNVFPNDIPCNIDEMDSYGFLNGNQSQIDLLTDGNEMDVEFKASSLLIALNNHDDIVGNADTCLVVNRTLQEVVVDLLQSISDEQRQIEVSKQHLLNPNTTAMSYQTNTLDSIGDVDPGFDELDETKSTGKKQKKRDAFLVRCPYFQSGKYSIPHDNSETEVRKSRGEFNVSDYTPLYWRVPDNKRLIRAVTEDYRQRKIQDFERELSRLENELSDWLLPKSKKTDMTEKVKRLKEKIFEVRSAPVDSFKEDVLGFDDLDAIDWMRVSASGFDGTISERNLRLTWKHRFLKTTNCEKWSKTEDEELLKAVEVLGLHSWEEVAKQLNTNRTPFSCLQRYQQYLSPKLPSLIDKTQKEDEFDDSYMYNTTRGRRLWSPEEDQRLRELVSMATDNQGIVHWRLVAPQMEGRSHQVCITRWRFLNPHAKSGPFTEEEDVQLLLAVQRYGMRNFALVASNALPDRDYRDCKTRYNQLLRDLASEWTYEEDRKLYLLTNELLNSLSKKNITVIPTRCFQNLLSYFPGKSWQCIRSRYYLLMSWKGSYEKLRQSVFIEKDKADKLDEKTESPGNKHSNANSPRWSKEEVRAIFMRTPFMLNLLQKLRSAGVKSGETLQHVFSSESSKPGSTTEVQSNCDTLIPGSEVSSMLKDASEGLVVPRPLGNEQFGNVIKHTQKKMMIRSCVYNYLLDLLKKEEKQASQPSVYANVRRMDVLHMLLDDEDRFWLALEQSLRHHVIADNFYEMKRTYEFLDIVPKIAQRMINDTYKLCNTNTSAKRKRDLVNDHSESDDNESSTKRVRLETTNKLRFLSRDTLTHRHKMNRCAQLYHHFKKNDNLRKLRRWSNSPMNAFIPDDGGPSKVYRLLSQSLQTEMDTDQIPDIEQCADILEKGISINNLPPNKCTLGAFKTLLLHRGQLIQVGDKNMAALLNARRLSYKDESDNQIAQSDAVSQLRTMGRGGLRKPSKIGCKDESDSEIKTHQRLLHDPHYLLLRARMCALFLWPALLSTGKVTEYLSEIEVKQERKKRSQIRCKSMTLRDNNVFDGIRVTKRMKRSATQYLTQKVKSTRSSKQSWRRRTVNSATASALRRFDNARVPDVATVTLNSKTSVVFPLALVDLIDNGFQIQSFYSASNSHPCYIERDLEGSPITDSCVKREIID